MKINVAYLDYSSLFAGAERVLHIIIENLDRTQFEPYIIFPYPMEHHERYKDLNCKTHYLAHKKSWWMGSDYWKHPLRGTDVIKRTIFGIALAVFLKKNHIDILHVNLLRPDALMWLFPSKLLGIKILGHFRSHSIAWVAPKRVQKCCQLIVCVSKFSRSRLLLKGNNVNSCVVYDSIDISSFQSKLSKAEAKANLGYDEKTHLMVSVGQLSIRKGHDNAIRAFSLIADRFPDLRLFIVGGGSENALTELIRISKEFNVEDKVRFSEKQVVNIADIYCAADLTLSLSKDGEAFGLVPFESTCMETPFLAPKIGAVNEFIFNGENGLLVDTNNVEDIANCMEWVFNHYAEAVEMNKKVQSIINDQLSPSVMTANLEAIYKQL